MKVLLFSPKQHIAPLKCPFHETSDFIVIISELWLCELITSLHRNHPGLLTAMMTAPEVFHRLLAFTVCFSGVRKKWGKRVKNSEQQLNNGSFQLNTPHSIRSINKHRSLKQVVTHLLSAFSDRCPPGTWGWLWAVESETDQWYNLWNQRWSCRQQTQRLVPAPLFLLSVHFDSTHVVFQTQLLLWDFTAAGSAFKFLLNLILPVFPQSQPLFKPRHWSEDLSTRSCVWSSQAERRRDKTADREVPRKTLHTTVLLFQFRGQSRKKSAASFSQTICKSPRSLQAYTRKSVAICSLISKLSGFVSFGLIWAHSTGG